jgi:uncharacterized membrane protein SirB2
MIPYLRFAWAAYILVNSTLNIHGDFQHLPGGQILFEWMIRIITITFVLYCVIRGWEELKGAKFTNAKFFDVFGLVFEILILISGFIFLNVVDVNSIKLWRVASLILFQFALIAIIWTDFKKLRRPNM